MTEDWKITRKFEYDVIFLRDEGSVNDDYYCLGITARKDFLNAKGQERWELISIHRKSAGVELYFKRELI